MADYNLGTARGVIEIEYKGDGAARAQKDLGATGTAAGKAGMSLDDIGRKSGRAGLVVAAGIGLATKSAADFEQRLSAIKAVSGATSSEMEAIRGKALQLGKDTAFSAGESAKAMEELIKAGLSVDDVLNGAADATVNLAAAGEIDMAQAATIASNSMNQFNLSAKDMTGVVDNIAGAANASAIDVGEFGQSLQQVGAVAHLAGVNFDDTATAIALMGNAGIKGSDAGTSLKSMFMRLQPTTDKQANTMQDLGLLTYKLADANKTLAKVTGGPAQKSLGAVKDKLAAYVEAQGQGTKGTVKNAKAVDALLMKYGGLNNAFYDANGNTKSLSDVSGILAKSLKGMSKEQQQATLTTLFGSDAIRSAAVLANAGSKGFDKMAKSMGKVSAADVAKTRMDNFKGSLEQLKGSLETVGITIGTVVLPYVRKLVDGVTTLLNKFLNLSPNTQKVVTVLIALAGAGLLAVAAVIKITQAVRAYQAAMLTIRGLLVGTAAAENMSTAAAIRSRVASIAASVAEKARAAAMLVVRGAMMVATAAQWAFNAAMAANPIALVIIAIVALVAAIILLWKKSETFRNIILGVWKAVKDATVAVWDAIKSAVSAGVNAILTVVRAVTSAVLAVWRAFWGVFGGIIKASWGLVVALLRLGWVIIKGLFILYIRLLLAIWKGVWNAIVAVLRAVWNVIKAVVRAGLNVVKALVGAAWRGLKAVTTAIWNGIKAVIGAVWGRIGGTVTSAVNKVKSVVTGAWNAVKDTTARLWNAAKEAVGKAIEGIVNIAGKVEEKVTGALGGAGKWLYDKGREIIQGLIDGIASMINAVKDKVNDVTGWIGDHLPGSPVKTGPLRVLNHGYAGKQIIKMVLDGMDKMERPVKETMATITTLPPISMNLSHLPHAPVALPAGAGLVAAGAPARGGGGQRAGMRLVEGTLHIDKSGRAWIRGLAEEAMDDDRSFRARRSRQGGHD